MAYTDSDKANLLNSFFGSCFNTSHLPIELESPPPLNYPEELLCTESEVYDLLASLDVSKASGQDGISARMLKHTALSITPSITKLFNLSLQSAIYHSFIVEEITCGTDTKELGDEGANKLPSDLTITDCE